MGDWEPAPPISAGAPVTFQIGAVGAGLGVGCGVGIGFGGPLSLGAIPVLGQAAQGISSGVGGLTAVLGGAGATARAAVQGLGIKGLDAGFGCGVGIGYGFGAGLMVKPSVLEQATRAGAELLGRASSALSGRLQQAGIQPQSHQQSIAQPSSNSHEQPGSSSSSGMPAVGPYFSAPDAEVAAPSGILGSSTSSSSSAGNLGTQQGMFSDISSMISSSSNHRADAMFTAAGKQLSSIVGPQQTDQVETGTVSQNRGTQLQSGGMGMNSSSASSAGTDTTSTAQQLQGEVVVMRTLLQQQQEIQVLKKQNKQLRRALCKMNPKAPICDNSSRHSRRGSRRGPRVRDASDSTEWWDL